MSKMTKIVSVVEITAGLFIFAIHTAIPFILLCAMYDVCITPSVPDEVKAACCTITVILDMIYVGRNFVIPISMGMDL